MSEKRKRFLDDEEFPQLYSLNFLMAEFAVTEEETKKAFKRSRAPIRSEVYETHAFQIDVFYKNTSPLSFSLDPENDARSEQ